MKEYQFQYTKISDTLLVMALTIATFIATEALGIWLKQNLILLIILSLSFSILIFQLLKKRAVHICFAKLSDTFISFKFNNKTKDISFKDLSSYKSYYGKNGPVLYLNTSTENFKLSANNNFCNPDDFELFCDDAIAELDKYREKSDGIIIHEDPIFTKKSMLYFLIVVTIIYFLSFFIETKTVKISIGIGGGLYLLLMWTKYLIENKKLSIKNGS